MHYMYEDIGVGHQSSEEVHALRSRRIYPKEVMLQSIMGSSLHLQRLGLHGHA